MSSDDERITTKKKVSKKKVLDDSDDEVVTTKKSTKLKKKLDSDDDSDAEVATKKKVGKKKAAAKAAVDEDDDVEVKGKETHADPTVSIHNQQVTSSNEVANTGVIPFPSVDYDAMSYDDFLKHLQSKTKIQRMEEWRRHEESAAQASGETEENDEGKIIQRFTDGSGGFAYKNLLDRVMSQIPDKKDGGQVKIPAPQIERLGSKRTVIVNFDKMCSHLHRDPEDVKEFIEKQLTIQSSIDSNGCWVGRVQNVKVSQIENIFQKFIVQYVQCQMCFSIDTELNKDNHTRLTTMKCHKCKATRTVTSQGNATYQATTMKRSKIRAKAAM